MIGDICPSCGTTLDQRETGEKCSSCEYSGSDKEFSATADDLGSESDIPDEDEKDESISNDVVDYYDEDDE